MNTSTTFDQCDNGQIAVDEGSQVIVATGMTNCNADNRELLPLIDEVQATLGAPPSEVLADAGHRSEATFQTLEARGITAFIAIGHEVRPAKPPNPAHVATQRMVARLASDAGRARDRRRKARRAGAPMDQRSPWLPPRDDAWPREGPWRVERDLPRHQLEALTSTPDDVNGPTKP